MDDRAFGDLSVAPGEVRQRVLAQFKPRREGEDDYSALVASFTRAIIARQTVGKGGGKQRPPPRRDGDGEAMRATRETKGDRASSPLANFRMRYPMDERAFSAMERAPPGVQATVISDFKPRREGEDDYSALVMTFVRAVQSRVGETRGGKGKGGGGNRDGDRDRDRDDDRND